MAIKSAIVPFTGNKSSAIVKPQQRISSGHAVSSKSADAGRSMRRSALLLMRKRIQRDRLEKKYFGLLDKQKLKSKARAEENKQEQTSFLSGVGSGIKQNAAKLGGNLFGAIGDLLGFLALNWMADPANHKLLTGIVKGVTAIIKFVDWFVTGSVSNFFDGFYKMLKGDSLLERVVGFFQMATGVIGIFYALNPLTAIKHAMAAPRNIRILKVFFKKWAKKGFGAGFKFMFPKTAKVLEKIKTKLSSVFKVPQVKEFVKKVLSKIKIGGGRLLKGKGIVNLIAKKLIAFSKGNAGKALKTALRTIVKPAQKVIKNIPIIGPLIGFGLNLALGDPPGKALFKVAGASMGQWLGAAVGTMLFPGIGTLLGGLLGNLVGDFLGGRMYQIFIGNKPTPPTREEQKKAKFARKAAEMVEKGKMTQEEADEWARKELINWKRKDKRWRKENLFVVMWQGINKDQTEFDIDSAGGFQHQLKSGQYIKINNEIMKVLTNKSVYEPATKRKAAKYKHNTITVVRGVEGSEASVHNNYDNIVFGDYNSPIIKDAIASVRTASLDNGSKNINVNSKLNSNNNGNIAIINQGGNTTGNYTTINSVNTNNNSNNSDQKNL